MLDVTIDLITQTASSSLFAFCFCNLIIVIILVGSKPASEFEQDQSKARGLAMSSNTIIGKSEKELLAPQVNDDEDIFKEEEEEEVLEEEDDDELRKRFEDFIQKVNKGWKAELLKSSHLIEA